MSDFVCPDNTCFLTANKYYEKETDAPFQGRSGNIREDTDSGSIVLYFNAKDGVDKAKFQKGIEFFRSSTKSIKIQYRVPKNRNTSDSSGDDLPF